MPLVVYAFYDDLLFCCSRNFLMCSSWLMSSAVSIGGLKLRFFRVSSISCSSSFVIGWILVLFGISLCCSRVFPHSLSQYNFKTYLRNYWSVKLAIVNCYSAVMPNCTLTINIIPLTNVKKHKYKEEEKMQKNRNFATSLSLSTT